MTEEYYISLIIQQLSEGISAEQEIALNNWLSMSGENMALKSKLVKSWNKADSYKQNILIDEDSAWTNIVSKLPSRDVTINQPTKIKTIPIWRRPLSIAASLLLLIGFSWFFLSSPSNHSVSYSTNSGETINITLPDGSLIDLNENSQLAYVDEGTTRSVKLSGEGFFNVSHDPEKPFIVESNKTTTTVLGTKFNIDASSKEHTDVSLFEGKVSFKATGQNEVILLPGDLVSFNNSINQIQTENINNENAIAWKTKQLSFEDQALDDVINTIEKYFDKDIELDRNNNNCVFTGSFKNPQYKEVIAVLEYTYDMSFISNGDSDKIVIKNCK